MEIEIITAELKKVLNYYKSELQIYTSAQFFYKQADDIWSIGQMYQHLAESSLYFFLKRANYCIEQRNGQIGGELNANGVNVFKNNSFPPIKIKIPEALRGPEPVAKSIEEYSPILVEIGKIADDLSLFLAENDGVYKCLQPSFGWLNASEWYQLLEIHLRHHLRQKAELDGFLKHHLHQ